ncbi:MAG: diguanylate cyclase [Myxococcaceae bacterium]
MSVGKKLFWALGVPGLLIALLGVYLFWQQTDDAVHTSTHDQARALAEFVSTSFNVTAAANPGQTSPSSRTRSHAHRAVTEAVRSDARLFQPVKSLRILDTDGVVRWSRRIEEEDRPWYDALRILSATDEAVRFDEMRMELLQPLGGMSCASCHDDNALRVGVLQLELSQPELLRRVQAVFMGALRYVVLVGGIIVLGMVIALHAFLTRPLGKLTQAMQRAEQGDLLVRAPITSHDEMGRLASAFNRMLARMTAMKAEELETQRDLAHAQAQLAVQQALAETNATLERRLTALTLLYDVARSLTATLELSELLRRITDLVVGRLAIEQFSVMLLEPDGRLVVKIAQPRDRGTEGLFFSVGEGAAGRAASTLKPIYIEDVEHDTVFTRRPGTLQKGSLLCVPMIHKDSLLGVINLERPTAKGFTAEEIELLTAVAGQAAMAVKNAKLHEETVALSITDPLTGAPNRRHLFSRLEMEIARAHRFGTSVSFLMIDIDHFKALNDAAGHRAGDITLKQVSDLIKSVVRKVDTLGRYGGEEFVLVLPQIHRAEALEVAEKLRRAVEEHPFTYRTAQPSGHVTISVGVATLPVDANTLEKLVDCADAALYASKRSGRNRVTAYEAGMENHPGRERGPHVGRRPEPLDKATPPGSPVASAPAAPVPGVTPVQ